MYAVVVTGGKQYRVEPGEWLRVEKLEGEEGSAVTLDRVLMIADGDAIKVGAPALAGASVTAEIIGQGRGKKVDIIKFRRRKHHRKHQGHRQAYTEIKITSING
ncbi:MULTISPECIES: 50S ribosomal protein L21 [Halothiobacillus]|jgi:large subunit ribosomal protein L21|uniref:Large ribosomal subunit protein bL21 n=1 Tax=Halothiobacillus neapolitanus (strain ATCC 23641 / DSM 15147 / CIP 104769 / NCIMB 8539 / c2) TaxID=555778 RepID=D0KXB9_HALNC|nr:MULTISPECIES: 50S ribosomal protein L21 [Halothiobacillus]ACX95133.1 ribosomal protein L21 [Halothiobacillus neapolitanus c2]MDD4966705.1 50S ribosomal protein L21 [Halothiobacillus sp.]MDY0147982.1 50S ribosomal protein L21 [Halothiobacillus sp.]TDN60913.1 LSU ribosomal protein L21P [Halothiobacillus neapolitanus]